MRGTLAAGNELKIDKIMNESDKYDKKSLRLVEGKTADWEELAKDCVAFANLCTSFAGRTFSPFY